MKIVVLASQKGGVGKSTLAAHLAVEAERTGDGPVALIDTDPQGSLSAWWNVREAQTPTFAQITLSKLPEQISQLASRKIKLLFIDTPPALSEPIRIVAKSAHLILVPVRPSPHDLRSVAGTVDLLEPLGKPMVFLVNSATVRARITADAAVALSQHGKVAPVMVHHRVDFAVSMIDGRTVGEINPDGNSATEITNLWKYVNKQINTCIGT